MGSSNDIFRDGEFKGHCCCFNVIFEEEDLFNVSFEEECLFCVDFGELVEISISDYYDGEYIITPLTNDQILETEQKAMYDNVTVLAVPYTEVSNVSGGLTAIIGF